MKKVYEITIKSKRYWGNAEKTFSILATGITQALAKGKNLCEWHEEVISIELLTELE